MFQVFKGKVWCQPRTFDSCSKYPKDRSALVTIEEIILILYALPHLSSSAYLLSIPFFPSVAPSLLSAPQIFIQMAAEVLLSYPNRSHPPLWPLPLQGLLASILIHLAAHTFLSTHQHRRLPCCLTFPPSYTPIAPFTTQILILMSPGPNFARSNSHFSSACSLAL